MDRNKTMKYEDIERIIPSSRENIFTFELTDQNCVEVEFLNAQGKKKYPTKHFAFAFFFSFQTMDVNSRSNKNEISTTGNSSS
jgi:hypothetical protein